MHGQQYIKKKKILTGVNRICHQIRQILVTLLPLTIIITHLLGVYFLTDDIRYVLPPLHE